MGSPPRARIIAHPLRPPAGPSPLAARRGMAAPIGAVQTEPHEIHPSYRKCRVEIRGACEAGSRFAVGAPGQAHRHAELLPCSVSRDPGCLSKVNFRSLLMDPSTANEFAVATREARRRSRPLGVWRLPSLARAPRKLYRGVFIVLLGVKGFCSVLRARRACHGSKLSGRW